MSISKTEGYCGYCGRKYAVEQYHVEEKLLHHFCSHGCRLACELPLDRNGERTVSIDSLDDADRTCIAVASDEVCEDPRLFDYVRHAVKTLLVLDTRTREIVLRRVNGESYADISRAVSLAIRRNVGTAAVHVALVRAIRRAPWLSVLFEAMVEKQKRRMKK